MFYLMRYAWVVNYLFWSWGFCDHNWFKMVPWTPWCQCHFHHEQSSELDKSSSLTSCAVLWQSVTFEMFLPTSNPQFWARRKFKIQTAKPVHLLEKGLNKLRINLAEVNLTHKIEPEVCLTLPLESQHLKYPSCTVLEFARDLSNTMH